MASATWRTSLSPERRSSSFSFGSKFFYSPIFSHGCGPLDDDADSGLSSAPPPSLLRRLIWRHAMLIQTVEDIALLLLLGTLTNVLAFVIDHAIEAVVSARARASQEAGSFLPSYLVWTGSSLLLCSLSAAAIHFIGPSAAGSGIPQMKCVLAGMRAHDYLSLRTLCAKVLSLVFALGGGLSIGKEGPYVHISSCMAQQLSRLPCFRRIGANEELRRQLLAAGCAAGVSATFGAPVGGVLFSIEVTCTYYSISHMWKAMFASVCGSVVFRVSRANGELQSYKLTSDERRATSDKRASDE